MVHILWVSCLYLGAILSKCLSKSWCYFACTYLCLNIAPTEICKGKLLEDWKNLIQKFSARNRVLFLFFPIFCRLFKFVLSLTSFVFGPFCGRRRLNRRFRITFCVWKVRFRVEEIILSATERCSLQWHEPRNLFHAWSKTKNCLA